MDLFDRFVHKYGRLPTEFDRDYLEMLAMSKYQIVDIPRYKKAECANCGSSKGDGRKYIDIGLEIDWHGIVYFCGLCLKDIARAFGLFKEYEEQIVELQKKLEDAALQYHWDKDTVKKFTEGLEEVKEYLSRVHNLGDNYTGSDLIAPVAGSSRESSKSSTDKPESGITKQDSSGGSEGIPSFADLFKTG